MTLPLDPATEPDAELDEEDPINDPGNEDPGSVDGALVHLIEEDDRES
jgi:hypothetical protein